MDASNVQTYLIPALLVGFLALRFLKFRRVRSVLPKLIEDGAVIVDVRSAAEFQQGSRPGSINIPLGEIGLRSKELDRKRMIILCCASGTRSGVAAGILKKNGFSSVINAGSWTNTI